MQGFFSFYWLCLMTKVICIGRFPPKYWLKLINNLHLQYPYSEQSLCWNNDFILYKVNKSWGYINKKIDNMENFGMRIKCFLFLTCSMGYYYKQNSRNLEKIVFAFQLLFKFFLCLSNRASKELYEKCVWQFFVTSLWDEGMYLSEINKSC